MQLRRSNRHKMIAGVCGGIAEWLGWSPIGPGLIEDLDRPAYFGK